MFRRDNGELPSTVAYISWAFKSLRLDIHRESLKWPREMFAYLGVNNPSGKDLKMALAGELALVKAVKLDPYVKGRKFAAKREARNPFHLRHDYWGISPELDSFFGILDSA